jgi:ATP-dependent exoDNAse (exonuclease V) alpha subunit
MAIPVIPWKARRSFPINICNARYNIVRTQVPLLPAFAITIEKCQGQNIDYSLLDIFQVPSGTQMTLAHLYVAFSRSRGRANIRILRQFNDRVRQMFHTHVPQELRREDRRIAAQAETTKASFNAHTLFDSVISPDAYDYIL